MASTREKPTSQRALTILKPLRDIDNRMTLEGDLRRRGDALHPDKPSELRGALDAIEGLHYLSWFVIDGVRPKPTKATPHPAAGPPLLVLEANFDGSKQEFLRRLAGHPDIEKLLDKIYVFCEGYPTSGSPEAKARWLALGSKRPQVFYVARPGQSTAQLKEEVELAADIEKAVSELGEPRGRRIEYLRRIWDRLTPARREQIRNPPVKPFWVRYSLRNQPLKALLALVALLALGGALTFVLIGMHAWGVPLWPWLVPPDQVLTATIVAALVLAVLAGLGIGVWLLCHLVEAPKDITLAKRISIWVRKLLRMAWATLKALPAAIALLSVVALLSWQGKALLCLIGFALLGLLLLAMLLFFLLVLIAMAELVDTVDDMTWDKSKLTPIKHKREDLCGQNHFVSVTQVKPGWLRQIALRTVLLMVDLLAVILYDPRGLAGIPSIHFARWQTLDGGRRLLFATNYDGGWGGYLGEFVAIAAFGMNAIWGNTGGFPRTFYLFFSGVKDEQRFKCYARNSQFETLLWYQRYPQLSLAAIRRNSELLEELARLSAYLEPPSRLSAYFQPDIDLVKESELDRFLRRFAIPGEALMEDLELKDIQGFVRHGYPYFVVADYLLLRFDGDIARVKQWLRELRSEPEPWLDHADLHARKLRREDGGVAIAFTDAGLRKLGVQDEDMKSFVIEFQEGMAAPHRSRLLQDIGENAPDRWNWGLEDDLHALLIVFWNSEHKAFQTSGRSPTDKIVDLPGCPSITRRFTGFLQTVEPFGFADGMSQPFVEGLTQKKPPPGVRPVKAGEFVLGYRNEFNGYPASPSVVMDERASGLRQLADGRADFGRNGSFLVMRQLEQHVDVFKEFVSGDEHLGARMVGRWKSGEDLVRHAQPGERAKAMRELEEENDFSYHREDRHGLRCPIGAHIRRANPRDALADDAGISAEEAQALVDRHRILRRGRVYLKDHEQGLLFLCLNANIERQFEFVQGTWLMNPEFGGLRGETDPLLGYCKDGATRSMTCQHARMARRVEGLQRFVTMRGGAYFFLPGLKAIDYLAS